MDRPRSKSFMLASCWRYVGSFVALGCVLDVFNLHSNFCNEKTWKKVGKSKILASQNPPKIHPKCLPNRTPQKHVIFHRFLFQNAPTAKMPTRVLYWFFPHETLVGHFSSNRFSRAFWVQKTYQKPFQNEVRTLQKSMRKTMFFFNIDFFGFRARFWTLLGLSWVPLGRSWASLGRSWASPGRFLDLSWALLGTSSLLLGSHGRLQARFWEVLGSSGLGLAKLLGRFCHSFCLQSLGLHYA